MNRWHAAALAAAVGALALPLAGSAAAPETATIASSSAVGFRAVVTATKGTGGGAPTASVTVSASEKVGGTWRPLGRVRVGRANGFSWNVVTGPHAIRQFAIDTSSPERVTLQVLVSPALGWSPVYRLHVENGTLVRG